MRKVHPIKHLIAVDPVLASVVKKVPQPEWSLNHDYFQALVEDIINQQLSDKASVTITERFNHLFPSFPYTQNRY